MIRSAKGPCSGLSVIELCTGVSDLGLGMAGSLPGLLLGELGADVVRVVDPTGIEIDAELPWSRVWNRDKKIRKMDDPEQVRALMQQADIALVYGPEELVEGRGMGYTDVHPTHPELVYVRCRASRTATGSIEEFGLLVEARSGFCTQIGRASTRPDLRQCGSDRGGHCVRDYGGGPRAPAPAVARGDWRMG